MLAKPAIRCNISHGTRARGSMQGHPSNKGRTPFLLRRVKNAPAPAASTRSPQVISAASTKPPTVPIKIQVEYRTNFGQILKVVGAGEVLGDWDPKHAPEMEWQDGDIWSTTLPLSPGKHEFKLVVAAADASSSIWEGGNNRTVQVPSVATTGGAHYVAECHWGNPETSMKPGGPEGVATYDEEDTNANSNMDQTVGKMTIGKMTIETGSGGGAAAEEVDDDEEKEIGKMTIGKMTIEGSPAQDTTPSATTTVGKMTMEGGVLVRDDLIDTGLGAEEGFGAAEAMTPEIAMAMASGDEDQLESPFAKAIGEILQNLGLGSRDSDNDDDDENLQGGGGSGGGSSRASGNKPSGGGSGSSSTRGSTGAGPSSFKFAAAAAAAAVLMTSSGTSSSSAAAFAAPTNLNLSSLVDLSSPFVSPAQAAAVTEGEKEGEDLLLASTPQREKKNSKSSSSNAMTIADSAPLASSSSTTSAANTTLGETNTTPTDPNAEIVDDDSSTLEEFRESLRWLNKVTTEAQQELDTVAPPPLKSALDSAVKAAKETDVGPALDVTKRVLGDLQEGFSGLFSAAKDFDAATASANLKERMEKELAARKEIEDAVAAKEAAAKEAAANAVEKKQAADEAKALSEQQLGAAPSVSATTPAPTSS